MFLPRAEEFAKNQRQEFLVSKSIIEPGVLDYKEGLFSAQGHLGMIHRHFLKAQE